MKFLAIAAAVSALNLREEGKCTGGASKMDIVRWFGSQGSGKAAFDALNGNGDDRVTWPEVEKAAENEHACPEVREWAKGLFKTISQGKPYFTLQNAKDFEEGVNMVLEAANCQA